MSKQTQAKMSLVQHLEELRKRLIIILVSVLLGTIACYQFIEVIMQYVLSLGSNMQLIYITPSELFMVYVKISMILGIVISSPISLLQVWIFVAKGLYKKEKLFIVLTLVLGAAFFAAGVYFCYQVVIPVMLHFFLEITIYGITPMISIASFVSFIITMLLCFGIAFEMPVVSCMLSAVGLITPEFLLKKQPVIIIVIFILAAFITPPDIISQLLLAVPMVLLLEISIGVSYLVLLLKKKKKTEK